MIKTPVALFPFSLEMLGLVRNFNQLQEKYLLTKVIAPTGCGVIHKDAGYIANQTNTGYIVSDTLYEENDIWEILLITEVFKEEKTTYSQKLEYINLALKMNKKVICFTQGYSNILKDTEEIAAKYRNNFTTISSEYLFNKENLLLKQSAIQIPIILVGGLLMEADVTEVVYELTETLKNKNFNVMTYTNNIVNTIWNAKTLTPIFLNKTITESGKISSIKSVIKRDIYKERPDVIIIEAPDAIMQYNDYIHNGYGILTYMLSQSINIDYFICCIPFELADNSLLSNISQDLEAKSGYSINAVHASNIILDTADTLQRKEISIIHTPLSQVKHHLEAILQENIPIVNVFNDGMDKFLKILIEV